MTKYFIFLIAFSGILAKSNVTTTHKHKRLISIRNISISFNEYTNKPWEAVKTELTREDSNKKGLLYLDLKERGFKFTFNKNFTLSLIAESSNFFSKIFKDNIGTFNISNSLLNYVRLNQPKPNSYTPFEITQIKDQCWKVDIFPKPQKCEEKIIDKPECINFLMNIRFCIKDYEQHLKVRQYYYLLEAKELEGTNKE